MSSDKAQIHLVSFSTPCYRHRQVILELSAKLFRVADTVSTWTLGRLKKEGFERRVDAISLDERGAGYWSWKPYVICHTLEKANEGDIVLYCDVGRIYPFKLLDQPLAPFLKWMDEAGQDVMPGVEIPWDGPMVKWTKRDALLALDMDRPDILESSPIQASFSIWRVTPATRALAAKWFELCRQRKLVSDDPSEAEVGEHAEFYEHRHDQALSSLLCMKMGIRGMSLGVNRPDYDCRSPSLVLRNVFGEVSRDKNRGLFKGFVSLLEKAERKIRRK